jgi:hypothetical protein
MNRRIIERLNEDARTVLERCPDAPVVTIRIDDKLRERLGLEDGMNGSPKGETDCAERPGEADVDHR